MALFEIATLGSFAKLLLAARKLAEDPDPLNRLKALADLAENGGKLRAALGERNLGPLAASIEADCKNADAAFAREPGVADARVVFRDVAAVALTWCDALAENGLDRAVILQDLVKAIDASDHARDFRATALPETYFRAVLDAALKTMLADAAFVDGLSPQLWRESLARQGVEIEILERLESTVERGFAQQDAKLDALLKHVAATDEAQRLSKAGVTEKALIELAQRIVDQVADIGDAWTELQNAIELAIRVQQEGRHGSNLGDFVDEVLRRVAAMSAQGDYDEAAAEIDRSLEAAEAEHKARTLRLLEAGLEQDRLRRNPEAAAQRVVRMAEVEGSAEFAALRKLQDAWYLSGRDKGLNYDLDLSIEIARLVLQRANGPDERGTALNDLAVSLMELGQREAGTERLRQAVAAYRAALQEWTRERVPLDWARVQMNLGTALRTLGEREAGTARLEQAVAAYRAALEERTRERVPLDWARTQMNLGAALRTLGAREAGTARLEEAVAACRAALQEWTRERVPLDWALAQMNLGNALQTLGEREAGTARLEQAVAAYRAALQERTRERVPLDWAMVQMNLGSALQTLGAREAGTARLEEAVAAYRAALEEYRRERVPLDWARTQMNLGTALATLGAREAGTARLEQAVTAYRAALQEWTRERVPLDWATLQFNMGGVEIAIFDKTDETARLDAAEEHVRAARLVFEAAGATQYLGMAETKLAEIARRREGVAG